MPLTVSTQTRARAGVRVLPSINEGRLRRRRREGQAPFISCLASKTAQAPCKHGETYGRLGATAQKGHDPERSLPRASKQVLARRSESADGKVYNLGDNTRTRCRECIKADAFRRWSVFTVDCSGRYRLAERLPLLWWSQARPINSSTDALSSAASFIVTGP